VYEYFPTDGRDEGKDGWTNNNEDGTSLELLLLLISMLLMILENYDECDPM